MTTRIGGTFMSTTAEDIDLKIEQDISVFDAFQIISVFPEQSKEYELAANVLILESRDNHNIDLGEQQPYFDSYVFKDAEDFDVTLERIKKIPNLNHFSSHSAKFIELMKMLEDLSDKDKLCTHVVNYLQKILSMNQANEAIQFATISLLLTTYFGVNGTKITNEDGSKINNEMRFAIKESVKRFLSANEFSLSIKAYKYDDKSKEFSTHLLLAFSVLKRYLHNIDRTVRIKARTLCENFKIPLDLPKMLTLSMDGVTTDNDESVDDLVLVIGGTGAGKSTIINYLSGVDFILKKDIVTGTRYLEHTGNKQPPTKVGHSSMSQTLYPQIIKNKDFSFADVAGFDDTRDNDQVICANLSVPYAVHYAKKIRTILIVLEYNITMSNNRASNLRMLCQTLSELIPEEYYIENQSKKNNKNLKDNILIKDQQDIKVQKNKIPFIFAITKPPIPDYSLNETFDPNQLRRELVGSLKKVLRERHTEADDSEKLLAESKECKQTLNELDLCIDTLDTFLTGKNNLDIRWSFSSIISHISSTVKEGKKANLIKEKCEELVKTGMPRGAVDRLAPFFYKYIDISEDERGKLIAEYKNFFENEKNKIRTNEENTLKKFQEKKGERSILELMIRNQNNIFIMRCYESTIAKDQKDHRELLFQRLHELKSQKQNINSTNLQFNPKAELFAKARDWTHQTVSNIFPIFEIIIKIIGKMKYIDERRYKIQKSIEDDKFFLESYFRSAQSAPSSEMMQKLETMIHAFRVHRDTINREIVDLHRIINAKNSENMTIMQNTTVQEYGSDYIAEKTTPSFFSSMKNFFSGSTWTYRFPGKWNKQQSLLGMLGGMFGFDLTNIPIKKVEISCITTDDDKLAFQTQIKKEKIEACSDFSTIAISNKQTEYKGTVKIDKSGIGRSKGPLEVTLKGKEPTGTHSIEVENFKNGDFILTYRPKNEHYKFCGVRVFVLPKYIPKNVRLMDKNRIEIEESEQKIEDKSKEVTNLERKINSSTEALRLLTEGGLGSSRQKSILERVNELFYRLDYTKERFIHDFFSTLTTEDIQRLERPDCLYHLKELAAATSKQFSEDLQIPNMNMHGFYAILGVDPPKKEIPELSKKLFENYLKNVPKEFVIKLYYIAVRSGITVSTLQELLRWKIKGEDLTWKMQLDNLNVKRGVYQSCYEYFDKLIKNNVSLIQTLRTNIKILGVKNDTQFVNFNMAYQTIKDMRIDLFPHINTMRKEIDEEISKNFKDYINFGIHKIVQHNIIISQYDTFVKSICSGRGKGIIPRSKGTLLGRDPYSCDTLCFDEYQFNSEHAFKFTDLKMDAENFQSLLTQFSENQALRKELIPEILLYNKGSKIKATKEIDPKQLYLKYDKQRKKTQTKIEAAKEILLTFGIDCKAFFRMDILRKLKEECIRSPELIKKMQEIDKSIRLEKNILQDMEKFDCSEQLFREYILELKSTNWIGYKTLKLLAQKLEYHLRVWTHSLEVPGILELVDSYQHPSHKTTIHILIDNDFTHYGMLVESKKVELKEQYEFAGSDIIWDYVKTNESYQNPLSAGNPLSAIVYDTQGEGDCAFHAVYGTLFNDVIRCKDVSEKRKMVADAIRKVDNNSPLLEHVVAGIQAVVMTEREGFQALRKSFNEFSIKNKEQIAKIWESFENALKFNRGIYNYIYALVAVKENLKTFHDQFQYCLTVESGTLYGLISADPTLKKLFQEYNTITSAGFDFVDIILKNKSILEEYANMIQKPHQWLLPQELWLLAIVSDITIRFFSYNPYTKKLSVPEDYNRGHRMVGVCFNGYGHFEQVKQNYLQLSPAMSIIFSAQASAFNNSATGITGSGVATSTINSAVLNISSATGGSGPKKITF